MSHLSWTLQSAGTPTLLLTLTATCLEHSTTLGAESVQIFVEITQAVEAEPEAHTEEEWQVLLDIDQRLRVLEEWVASLRAQR